MSTSDTQDPATQVACAVHTSILSNGHEYGPVDEITKLVKPFTGRM